MKNLTLILGALEGTIYIVFAQEGQIACYQEWNVQTKGVELLTPLLQDSLKNLRRVPQDISRTACMVGPGNFTSLRIVLTTAAAIRRALSIPLAPLSSLKVLASSLSLTTDATLRTLTIASRDLLYMQDFQYDASKDRLKETAGPKIGSLQEACLVEKPTLFVGSGVIKNIDYLSSQALINPLIILYKKNAGLSSRSLLQAAEDLPKTAWIHRDLDPIYLRECDAVENLSKAVAKTAPSLSHDMNAQRVVENPLA